MDDPKGLNWAIQLRKCVLSFSKYINEAKVYNFLFRVFLVDYSLWLLHRKTFNMDTLRQDPNHQQYKTSWTMCTFVPIVNGNKLEN